MKLTFREKYSYGIGAFGKDLVYAFVATYLMMFFTDEVGISSVFVGGLFFVSRFWDAINDPIMGKIVDNTNTKWGKFRPWLLIGTLINAVVLIFLFISLFFYIFLRHFRSIRGDNGYTILVNDTVIYK